ncbi:MAG: hypothetical protein WCX64_06785 [Candidatus Micrarchaeia archaeon]
MQVEFKPAAAKEFLALDRQLQVYFKSHLEKLSAMPPRRHLRFGLPHHVEDVTRQARLVFDIEGDVLSVVHCFATHKEYEKWYKSFK